jgi:outer membrane protein assembly factor BamB
MSLERDDFGLYRSGFGGRHSGVDMAFDRYGDPVKSIARGRVTLADAAAWNDEKGVVIIEHLMPDDSIVFSLYGHVVQTNGHFFPAVGQCINKGEIIAAVGNPKNSARHLHFEIRSREASQGGPGYSYTDPLATGWLHPLDFIQRWQLRLKPYARGTLSSSGGQIAAPILLADGGAIFAGDNTLERRAGTGQILWRLEVARLIGIVPLSDGKILGSTADQRVFVVGEGVFTAYWKADRPLQTPPFRVGESIVFVGGDQRVVSYTPDGKKVWEAGPFGDHLERAVAVGNLIAVSTTRTGSFNVYVLNESGKFIFQAAAPAPIIPIPSEEGGFYLLVGPQIGRLFPDGKWVPFLDTGLSLGRSAQIATDRKGNVYVYPGHGNQLYAFDSAQKLRWTTPLTLTSAQFQPPLLGVGSGCVVYILNGDGSLNTLNARDGTLTGLTRLYAGGARNSSAARWLRVDEQDQVLFSAGFLSLAGVNGLSLAGLSTCEAS